MEWWKQIYYLNLEMNVHSINSGINWGPHSIPLANKSVLCSKILNELLYLILFNRTFNTQWIVMCWQIFWVNVVLGWIFKMIPEFSMDRENKQSSPRLILFLWLKNKNLKLVSRIPPKFFVVVLNLFFNYNL